MFSKNHENRVHECRDNMRFWLQQGSGGFYVMRYW